MFIAGNFAPGILPGISAPGLFDGIDIDWDLPGTETDVLDYVALLAEFRTQLNEIRPGLLLTTASVRDEYRQASLDPRIVLASVDWITVKSFDYWGPWQANISTYHHAPLYTAPGAPTVYSVDYSIQEFLAWGIPADRLTLSVGFYALGWLGVEAPGTNGLLQPAANPSSSYVDLTTLEAWGYPVSYDPIAKAVWSFSGNEFWSFENLETVDAKTRYAMDQQLLGVTIWPLTGEESGELLTTIAEILSGVE
jgi:chitinase